MQPKEGRIEGGGEGEGMGMRQTHLLTYHLHPMKMHKALTFQLAIKNVIT